MTYQVLARKWRPRTFSELIGQEHVVRALVNALDSDRVHHAFLFTGTRGVGKTTLARVFAKALNCLEGVSSEPCGQCASCVGIDEGRFFDLIEVDAASRTKVDDTRELLDNVQYAPTNARYKVYLIDEVHMLSNSSFNALLKTLEEPPPHVKFLLATTDPQKVPVTVLSRCLQFNLKRLSIDQIADYLAFLAQKESFEADAEALRQLAISADGSMRDGLSLLDQAIAYGAGQVRLADVQTMLGTVHGEQLGALVAGLCAFDGPALWRAAKDMIEHSPDYSRVLAELAQLFHRAALVQAVPETSNPAEELVTQVAAILDPADIQLFYQITVTGRRDLDLAPDHQTGFEMTLLRMLAFQPGGDEPIQLGSGSTQQTATVSAAKPAAGPAASATKARQASGGANAAREAARRAAYGNEARPAPASAPIAPAPNQPQEAAVVATPVAQSEVVEPPVEPVPAAKAAAPEQPEPMPVEKAESEAAAALPRNAESWNDIVASLGLKGTAAVLATNSILSREAAGSYQLTLDPALEHLHTSQAEDVIREALGHLYGQNMKLRFVVTATQSETPALQQKRENQDRQQAAEQAIDADPLVQSLRDQLGAEVVPGSVRPLDS